MRGKLARKEKRERKKGRRRFKRENRVKRGFRRTLETTGLREVVSVFVVNLGKQEESSGLYFLWNLIKYNLLFP